jgi:hypothetical protein
VAVVEGESAPAVTAPAAPEPTAEQTALISDLHWLVHQGHVIEFANGQLDTAKKACAQAAETKPRNQLRLPEPVRPLQFRLKLQ